MHPTPPNGYIELRQDGEGRNRAYLVDTNIRVHDVATLAEINGKSVDEIRIARPQLSLAQIHAALAYYFEHQTEVRLETSLTATSETSSSLPSVPGAPCNDLTFAPHPHLPPLPIWIASLATLHIAIVALRNGTASSTAPQGRMMRQLAEAVHELPATLRYWPEDRCEELLADILLRLQDFKSDEWRCDPDTKDEFAPDLAAYFVDWLERYGGKRPSLTDRVRPEDRGGLSREPGV